jgi:solute carrier family 35 protein
MLPVSDPPNDEDRERLLKSDDKILRGSSITKHGAFAAISYMSCAGSLHYILIQFYFLFYHQILSILYFCFVVLLVMFNKAALSSYNFPSSNFIALLQVDLYKAFSFFFLPTFHDHIFSFGV